MGYKGWSWQVDDLERGSILVASSYRLVMLHGDLRDTCPHSATRKWARKDHESSDSFQGNIHPRPSDTNVKQHQEHPGQDSHHKRMFPFNELKQAWASLLSDSVLSKDGHLPWIEARKCAHFQRMCTWLVAPQGQRVCEVQRRTVWWARHSKDTANDHLVQTCLY